VFALLLLFTTTASAAVLGIDFGTLNIKAAIVKPGIPLDIVLTKDSKRKETAALAFKPNRDDNNNIITLPGTFPERAYGGDALALQGRFPSEVFPNLKQLLGISGDEAVKKTATYQERYPALRLQRDEELGTTVFKSTAFTEDSLPYSVEELVGMELANIKRNAEALAGKDSVVEDVVITIPAFYTADEKRALVNAASFAGLNVLGLISDGLAVGLDYAKTRSFPELTKGEQPEYHLVYDMGAGSTTATVLRFQSRSVKDIGRLNKTVQEVGVQGVGWDRDLGGDALNHILMNDFVEKLLLKLKTRGTTAEEIRTNGRIMGRFWKEAERVRQVLSANTETNAGFEEILPDVDLRLKYSRTDFEKLVAGFATKVDRPMKQALEMAGLSMNDIKSVILHGGVIRTPLVQSKLEAAVGDKAKLRSNVNPDESAVFGAAFKAAGLSPSFKVKEIRDSDAAVYATSLVHSEKEKIRKQRLFNPQSPAGIGATVVQVSFNNKEDFDFGFIQEVEGVDRPVLRVQSENLTASVDQLSSKFGCEKDDVSTKFSVKLGATLGLPEVVSGSVSCEVDDTTKSSMGDSVKGWLGLGKKKEQVPLSDDDLEAPVEQVDATPSSSAAASASDSGTVPSDVANETPKKRTEVINVNYTIYTAGNPQPDLVQVARVTERLKDFDASDKARVEREEALNKLESYTYYVRDFLENDDFAAVSTAAQREEISKLLQTTKEWMESSEFSKASKDIFKEKLQGLKKLVEPIKTRKAENAQRPTLVDTLQKSLKNAKKSIGKVQEKVEKAKAALTSSSTASSETAAPSSDLDDLEEPESDEGATKAAPPASDDASSLANFDLSKINGVYDNISKWLEEKLAAQKKLKPHDDPVLTVRELEKKSAELNAAVQELQRDLAKSKKPAAKPKSAKPKASKKKSKGAESSADKDETAETVPEAGEDKPVVTGDESIDDILDRIRKNPDARPRDEL
jgi:hypoxia up-regulated 1